MTRKPADPPSYVASELAKWTQVRRYSVRRSMIRRATAAREAGDWEAACAAANVDIAFDLPGVARKFGRDVADRLAEDLRHFAPDLMRWHLPRGTGDVTTLAQRELCILTGYGERETDGPYLMARTPLLLFFPQRVRLEFGELPEVHPAIQHCWLVGSRHLWDVRRSDELRARYGGGARVPFFEADGTPRDGAPHPGDDAPATISERIAALHDAGDLAGAFAAAGLDIELPAKKSRPHPRDGYSHSKPPQEALTSMAIAPGRWAGEVAALSAVHDTWRVWLDWQSALELRTDPTGEVRGWVTPRDRDRGFTEWLLPDTAWRRLPDLDLLRTGRITPADLHPLVRSALFPALSTVDEPRSESGLRPVRVRCRGGWHQVQLGGGTLQLLDHPAEEEKREEALVALSGPELDGCFAVKQTWRKGGWGHLPRQLYTQRREFFARIRHGDTDGVEAMLDAGFDPATRDRNRRTLLHHLAKVDHERLLPRLLAAGLDVNARDIEGYAPLELAVRQRGPATLVRALIAAGAADKFSTWESSVASAIRVYRRSDPALADELMARVDGDFEEVPDSDDWWEDEVTVRR